MDTDVQDLPWDQIRKWVLRIVIAIILLILILNSIVLIRAGHVGVLTRFGAVTGANFEQGLHFKVPFVEGIHVFDIEL